MKSIQFKLLLSYLVILLTGVVVLLLAAQLTAPGAYARHMMTEMPGMKPGHGMGPGSGLANFRAGLFETLGYTLGAAALAAFAVSILLSRRIIAPLERMAAAAERIAEGHYNERVEIQGEDELAQLGRRFNQMAEKLESIEAMRRRLIGDVSHELRTPLTTIAGYMEGLMDGVLPANAETYAQIQHEAQRLERLVNDLQELQPGGSRRLHARPASARAGRSRPDHPQAARPGLREEGRPPAIRARPLICRPSAPMKTA